MLFVWGKNNHHLFKNNHKKTYSLPQRIQKINVTKCACGFDYIVLLTEDGRVHFQYESAIYSIKNIPAAIIDIATNDNAIVLIAEDGMAFIAEFNSEKIINSEITLNKIGLGEGCRMKRAIMNHGDIFLLGDRLFHLKRNEWYETKTYSDPVQISSQQRIVDVSPGINENYFLTEDGELWISQKQTPTQLTHFKTNKKFIQVCSSDYQIGITTKGQLCIWGNHQFTTSNQESKTNTNSITTSLPVAFGQITKRFTKVALGLENGFAITDQGKVWVWGINANGELGVSDYEQRLQPFPLITMDHLAVKDIFIGEGYTACIAHETNQKKKNLKISSMNFGLQGVNGNANNQPTYHNTSHYGGSLHSSANEFPCFQTFEISRVNDEETKVLKAKKNAGISVSPKHEHSNPKKAASKCKTNLNMEFKTTPLKNLSSTPVKNASGRSRSKSPSVLPQRAKTPTSNRRDKENGSKLKKEKEKDHAYTVSNHHHAQHDKLTEENRNLHEQNKHLREQNKHLRQQNKSLQQERRQMKRQLMSKDEIIEDITHKIRLLEQAIDEHERSLTARDTLVDEFRGREQQYNQRIQTLEDLIEKELNCHDPNRDPHANRDAHAYNQLYRAVEIDRQSYLHKIKEYQEQFKQERGIYQQRINKLEEEINSFRCSHRNRQDEHEYGDQPSDGPRDGHNEVSSDSYCLMPTNRLNQNIVEEVINKIEENKYRIGKSANKLIEMLEK